MRAATKDDWANLQPMAHSYERISLDLPFTQQQISNLQLGLIPVDQDQKWFLYFDNNTLHVHRSWTGFKMFEVAFESNGDGAVARFARVNLDPEFYSGTYDEARETLLELLHYFATDEAHEPYESGIVTALKHAARPNYLGSPKVVGELLMPLFWRSICKELPRYMSGLDAIPEFVNTNSGDVLAINQHITFVLCSGDEEFHGLENWRTELGLGQAIISQLELDSNWYADENLTCIVSEGLAGVVLHISRIINDWAKEDPPLDLDSLMRFVGMLQQFVTSIVMGTHTVLFPHTTLSDFTWKNQSRFLKLNNRMIEDVHEEEMLLPGPPLHPRLNDEGKPVRLIRPSTPTGYKTWHDSESTAIVIPDGPMPAELNGIRFDSWQNAPTDNSGWEGVAAQYLIDEPPFDLPTGKNAAAGAVVLEKDGRVWIVAPSNAYGNYPVTFPKGTREAGISLQGTALREAFEEAGLQVELTDFLIDVSRSASYTRYYLARRVGGNPADMSWESQSVILTPTANLPALLTNKNDAPIIAAIQALGL